MKKQLNYADIIKEALILTGAVAIIAAAVYFFLVPSHTSVSSISGLGIVLSNFVPLSLSAITMILNVVLLIIGFIVAVQAGIARRIDAGPAAEGVSGNARIVGQAGQAGGLHVIRRFEQGVFGEGFPRFFRFSNIGHDIVDGNCFIT